MLADEILGVKDMVVPFRAPNARAIRRWARQPGKLPPGKRVGNEIFWVKAEVLAWLSVERERRTDLVASVVADLVAGASLASANTRVKRGPGRPRKIQAHGLKGGEL
jgi:hypothetical protein